MFLEHALPVVVLSHQLHLHALGCEKSQGHVGEGDNLYHHLTFIERLAVPGRQVGQQHPRLLHDPVQPFHDFRTDPVQRITEFPMQNTGGIRVLRMQCEDLAGHFVQIPQGQIAPVERF